jgi:hypothetical protein
MAQRLMAPLVRIGTRRSKLALTQSGMMQRAIGRALGVADAATALASASPVYLTDTGGRWNADGDENRRDRVSNAATTAVDPSDTTAFAQFLREYDGIVYLSAHPERWPAGRVGQLQVGSTDLAVNLVKRALAAARRRTA